MSAIYNFLHLFNKYLALNFFSITLKIKKLKVTLLRANIQKSQVKEINYN
jgi:hypothetical protein